MYHLVMEISIKLNAYRGIYEGGGWSDNNAEGQHVVNEGKKGEMKIWKRWILWKTVGEVGRVTILGNVHNNYVSIMIKTYCAYCPL